MRRDLTTLLLALLLVAPLTGCQPSAEPAFTGSVRPASGEGTGGSGLVLVDVRVAAAEGYDRIVLEFSGAGTPGWFVDYVDEAALEGSGEVVELGGEAVLNIGATGTTWPAADYYAGPARLSPSDGGSLDEVYVAGTFEGYTQVLAGVEGERAPFRVFTLASPARLVVDVLGRAAG